MWGAAELETCWGDAKVRLGLGGGGNAAHPALVFPRVGCSALRRAAPLWRPSPCERLLTEMICCQMWLQMSRCCSAAARLVATARCCCLGDQNSEQFYTWTVLMGRIWTHPLMGRATFPRVCVCVFVCLYKASDGLINARSWPWTCLIGGLSGRQSVRQRHGGAGGGLKWRRLFETRSLTKRRADDPADGLSTPPRLRASGLRGDESKHENVSNSKFCSFGTTSVLKHVFKTTFLRLSEVNESGSKQL